MTRVHVAYDPETDSYVGAATVDTLIGRLPIFAQVPLQPLAHAVAQLLVEQRLKREGAPKDEVGFFGFVKKAWNQAWDTAKRVARAVGVTKVLRAVKRGVQKAVKTVGKVVRSPVFGAMMGVASFIPGVGPVAAAGYAAVRAAMAIADGASKGDPRALAQIGKYALPGGEKAMALIRSVTPSVNV